MYDSGNYDFIYYAELDDGQEVEVKLNVDYSAEVGQTHWEPGSPAEINLCEGFVKARGGWKWANEDLVQEVFDCNYDNMMECLLEDPRGY
jgi:hypothetical protein